MCELRYKSHGVGVAGLHSSALIMGTQIADFLRHLRGFRKYIFFCKTLCKKVFLSAENNANQAHSNCVKWC